MSPVFSDLNGQDEKSTLLEFYPLGRPEAVEGLCLGRPKSELSSFSSQLVYCLIKLQAFRGQVG